MKKFRYLPHTADAKFRAFGSSLEEAFVNSALAMFNIICNTDSVKPEMKKIIRISAKKKESLLYDFLEELLFLLDTEGFLLNKTEKLKITEKDNEFSLGCTVYGDNYKKYKVKGNIKSITYNDMFIKEDNNEFMIQAVVDL
ncbi:archease [Candidatus Woesearchaeota archaeon]|nr:archease [Candidatus Woesearchaeota archaeon]